MRDDGPTRRQLGTKPAIGVAVDVLKTTYQMDDIPTLRGKASSVADMQAYLLANRGIQACC